VLAGELPAGTGAPVGGSGSVHAHLVGRLSAALAFAPDQDIVAACIGPGARACELTGSRQGGRIGRGVDHALLAPSPHEAHCARCHTQRKEGCRGVARKFCTRLRKLLPGQWGAERLATVRPRNRYRRRCGLHAPKVQGSDDAVDTGPRHVTSASLSATPRKARVQGPRERVELNCRVLRSLPGLSETR